eukprot:363631-Chlamydomonas_euryale.AAC.7
MPPACMTVRRCPAPQRRCRRGRFAALPGRSPMAVCRQSSTTRCVRSRLHAARGARPPTPPTAAAQAAAGPTPWPASTPPPS